MGLSGHSKNALRISLGHQAANEIIPLLDILADEVKADQLRRAAKAVKVEIEVPAVATEPNPGPDPNEAGVPVVAPEPAPAEVTAAPETPAAA